MNPSDRKDLRVRKIRLKDEISEPPLRLSPEECFAVMEQLARDAWAMRGEPILASRLQRHVVGVKRLRG
jgi:hypothetical protein